MDIDYNQLRIAAGNVAHGAERLLDEYGVEETGNPQAVLQVLRAKLQAVESADPGGEPFLKALEELGAGAVWALAGTWTLDEAR